jgi:hypothetical protein
MSGAPSASLPESWMLIVSFLYPLAETLFTTGTETLLRVMVVVSLRRDAKKSHLVPH